jgi:predicted dehydrogenase/threonine dehydrogenase-like Zn-dependent dehydrogenase
VSELEPSPIEKAKHYSSTARFYLSKAIRHPDKALDRAMKILAKSTSGLRRLKPEVPDMPTVTNVEWSQAGSGQMTTENGIVDLYTDDTEFGYQAISPEIAVEPNRVPVLQIKGSVLKGSISVGFLNDKKDSWLGSRIYSEGTFEDKLVCAIDSSGAVSVVIANAGSKEMSHLMIEDARVSMSSPLKDGLPLSELDDQGWNVGYSAAGEVIAIGDGVSDIQPGDFVACAGAGFANHADYVCVPRNLTCKIPKGCSTTAAATTTVGTIALQGVRRAETQLGETICVIGLGLIGQITVQLLKASGCCVIGADLNGSRVERAIENGMDAGNADVEQLKQLVRDATGGYGVDRTIITAATKSDAVINLAMEVTRSKGRVVIVGDIGLNVQRSHFYRKEIDLVMSTSYGPGRYDRGYEIDGNDYPLSYVRWTLNRNMGAYLDLIASGKVDADGLIDKTIPVINAPQAYDELANNPDDSPLGVLIHYPDDGTDLPEPPDGTRIRIRGHRKAQQGPIRYALVGAGAFGTCMLYPQMGRVKNGFQIEAVVSKDTTRGGNFARANRIATLTTDLQDVLDDPQIELVVIATRHYEHADQVVRCLESGKHVFVEKPLALTWEELDRIVAVYEKLTPKPLLMVGFNRRYSPAISALKKAISNRRSPLVINYRLNGGYIPLDHWVQDKQGGGRNLGEACHMYDVFRSLSGATVSSITARAIDPGALPYTKNDNFCASITYDDGSLAHLTYTAMGPKEGMAKERIEVFCDNDAYVIEDFKELYHCSGKAVVWQNSEPDKGHFEEMRQLGEAIAGREHDLINFNELIETSAVALHIEDQIQGKV